MAAAPDPLLIEVIRNEFAAINEEMGLSILRTGRSVMVKIGDSATALADAQGRLIGQGSSSFQISIFMSVLDNLFRKVGHAFSPGDMFIVNDPYAGMGHMPDCGVVAPVFHGGRLIGFALAYSHHTDIGGRFPGGFTSLCSESYEEGLRIPIVHLYRAGLRNEGLVSLIGANVRNPEEWFGDVDAKVAGCRKGAQELARVVAKYGQDVYDATCDYLQDFSERAALTGLRAIPEGEYVVEDYFEEDGLGTPDVRLPIRVAFRRRDDRLTIDLTGTSAQAKGAINVPLGMTKAGLYGAFRAIVNPEALVNAGFIRPLDVIVPEGTIFNPVFPAATGGRAPLFFRLMDLCFRCLAQAVPDRVGVPGEGGDLIHFSGRDTEGRFVTFMDAFSSGWGGRPTRDGIDAVSPMALGRAHSTSVELLEREHPIVVEAFETVPDTEGPGTYRGALAMRRRWRFLAPGKVMIRSNRLSRPSEGIAGGVAGALTTTVVESDGVKQTLPVMAHRTVEVRPGDRIAHVICGTGGFGDPHRRDPERVRADVVEDKVSVAAAAEKYAVVMTPDSLEVDADATRRLRAER